MVLEIRMVPDGTALFGGNEEKLSRIMRLREGVSSADDVRMNITSSVSLLIYLLWNIIIYNNIFIALALCGLRARRASESEVRLRSNYFRTGRSHDLESFSHTYDSDEVVKLRFPIPTKVLVCRVRIHIPVTCLNSF